MPEDSYNAAMNRISNVTLSIQEYLKIKKEYEEAKRIDEKMAWIKIRLDAKMENGISTEEESRLADEFYESCEKIEKDVLILESVVRESSRHLVN